MLRNHKCFVYFALSLSLFLSLPCASDLSVCLPCSCPHVPSLSFALCLSPSRHVDTMIRQHLATLIPEASADGHEVASHRESEAYSKVCCSACTQAAHEGWCPCHLEYLKLDFTAQTCAILCTSHESLWQPSAQRDTIEILFNPCADCTNLA